MPKNRHNYYYMFSYEFPKAFKAQGFQGQRASKASKDQGFHRLGLALPAPHNVLGEQPPLQLQLMLEVADAGRLLTIRLPAQLAEDVLQLPERVQVAWREGVELGLISKPLALHYKKKGKLGVQDFGRGGEQLNNSE